MSASTVAAIGGLIDAHPELLPILAEHLEDNEGEVLAHLVMSDIVRWIVANESVYPATCQSVLDWMERRFVSGPEDVRELIVVSGVEMIPDPGQPGAHLRDRLSPALRKVDPWTARRPASRAGRVLPGDPIRRARRRDRGR